MFKQADKLFECVPDNLFSILTGPLKGVYVEILLVVYQQYIKSIYTLSKETVIVCSIGRDRPWRLYDMATLKE